MSTVNNIPSMNTAILSGISAAIAKGQGATKIGGDMSVVQTFNPILPEVSEPAEQPAGPEVAISQAQSVYELCLAAMIRAEADELTEVTGLAADGDLSQARMMQIQHKMQQASLQKELLRSVNDKVDEAEEAAARG